MTTGSDTMTGTITRCRYDDHPFRIEAEDLVAGSRHVLDGRSAADVWELAGLLDDHAAALEARGAGARLVWWIEQCAENFLVHVEVLPPSDRVVWAGGLPA